MIHEEPAEVGDKTPPAAGKNPYHAVRDGGHTMRAASSAEHSIKVGSDESHIGNAADETATFCIRLTGRQIVHYRRAEAVATDFGNARASNIPCDGPTAGTTTQAGFNPPVPPSAT